MSIVVPAILPASRADLERELGRYAPIEPVDSIQIDVVDGRFATPASWPYAVRTEFDALVKSGEQLPLWERFRYDIDLMVTDPAVSAGAWIGAGASSLTLHLESTTDLPSVIKGLRRQYGHEAGLTSGYFALGLAVGVETDPALLEHYIEEIDYVQLMGIAKIGRQGEPFDTRVLRQIRTLRAAHPELPIQIDGGVSLQTLPELIKAGATRLIVGSVLKKAPDPRVRFLELESLAERMKSESLGYTGIV